MPLIISSSPGCVVVKTFTHAKWTRCVAAVKWALFWTGASKATDVPSAGRSEAGWRAGWRAMTTSGIRNLVKTLGQCSNFRRQSLKARALFYLATYNSEDVINQPNLKKQAPSNYSQIKTENCNHKSWHKYIHPFIIRSTPTNATGNTEIAEIPRRPQHLHAEQNTPNHAHYPPPLQPAPPDAAHARPSPLPPPQHPSTGSGILVRADRATQLQ